MIPLIGKELQATSPYWLGAVAILAMAVLGAAFHGTLLLEPLGERFIHASAAPLWPCAFALLLGHGLVAHEAVHGQVHFLDGLPTTRSRAFAAKVVAGFMPCLVLVAGALAVDIGLESVAPVPFQTSGVQVAIMSNAAILATMWFYLGLGMLLSWLRGLAFGAVVALLFGAAMVTEFLPASEPWLPIVDGSYGTLAFHRGVASLDPWPILVWTVAGTGCMGLSGLLFLGPGDLVLKGTSAAGSALRWLGTAGLALFVGVLACGGLIELSDWLPTAQPILERQVGPLHVLYYEEDAAHVDAVLADAPRQVAEVASLLGHEGPLPTVEVEFMGGARNHLGVFTGGKVRVVRAAEVDVILHELGHVFAHRVSGNRRMHDDHHVRFFHEGLANWVAAQVLGESQLPLDVGWLFLTDQARFDLIVEDHLFSADQDLVQAYTLGQVFVDALVDVGGVPALGCTLRGMGRRAPGSKAGLALWYQVASDCDYVLDEVLSAWRGKLSRAADQLGVMPRLHASRVAGEPSLEVSGGDTYERMCRFRDDPSAAAHELYHQRVQDGRCTIPRGQLAGPTFDYQLGFAADGAEAWVYQRWMRDVPLD